MGGIIKDINELTPVERIGDYWFKRDDYFMPYGDIPINGGKVRQCISLLNEAHDKIVKDFNSTVVIGTSISTSMGIMVAREAREHGFRAIAFVGGTKLDLIVNNPDKYPLQTNVRVVGGELNADAKLGYYNILDSQIAKWTATNGPAFQVKYPHNLLDYPTSILGSISNQVQNLPDDLDVLIVPSGACITLSAILLGLERFNKRVGKVVGIQISGFDKRGFVNDVIGHELPYDFRISKDFKYATPCKRFYNGIELDWLYEGKAFDYMEKYMLDEIRGKNVCFWLVGNSTPVRTKVFGSLQP